MKKKKVIISIVAVLLVGVIIFLLAGSGKKHVKFVMEAVQEKTIETTVTATGYVQPVDKVDVGTQVSGVIEKIFVDFNSHVKKGQLLAELDKSTLSEKLTQANASLTSAQSDLLFAQQSYDRTKQLYDAKAATKAAYEDAVNRLEQAKTNIANAKANVHQAQVNLGYAEIYSPIDGVVLNRAVEQGQTVAASFNTPTLFTIANDLKKMQVEANVDEADIGQVQLGQKVKFTVDSYTDDTFDGTVSQIRLQPTVTSNVVTYTVIILAPNPEEKLFPGMTANITIITGEEKGLAVPAEALHFNPTQEMLNKKEQRPDASNKGDNARTGGKTVWIQGPQGIVRKEIKTGMSDGVNTIVLEGLHANDTVIVSAVLEESKNKKEESAVANPLMPKRPRGGRR